MSTIIIAGLLMLFITLCLAHIGRKAESRAQEAKQKQAARLASNEAQVRRHISGELYPVQFYVLCNAYEEGIIRPEFFADQIIRIKRERQGEEPWK